MQNEKTIADLMLHETAVISEHQNEALPLKLIQMGCTSNTQIQVSLIAPALDPICIQFIGNSIALRRHEAKKIRVHTG